MGDAPSRCSETARPQTSVRPYQCDFQTCPRVGCCRLWCADANRGGGASWSGFSAPDPSTLERGGALRQMALGAMSARALSVAGATLRLLMVATFPYSTKQVNRAGDRIRKATELREEPRDLDLELLDEFRAWHYPTLRHVQDRLSRLLHKKLRFSPVTFPVTARPLKTRQAIIAKLVRERTRLATMQDIAGTRVVVPMLEHQDRVVEAITHEFRRCKPVVAKDSRERGNRTGYRAVHVVVSVEVRFAEIQIRTRSQEYWAQIVEETDAMTGYDFKHGVGPAEWLEWLQDLSDALRAADLGEPFVFPPTPSDHLISES
jgi:ppGpp synthetase/RelA/SpoT-type nucleotidyltranferase